MGGIELSSIEAREQDPESSDLSAILGNWKNCSKHEKQPDAVVHLSTALGRLGQDK